MPGNNGLPPKVVPPGGDRHGRGGQSKEQDPTDVIELHDAEAEPATTVQLNLAVEEGSTLDLSA